MSLNEQRAPSAIFDVSSIDGGTTATPARLTAVEVELNASQVLAYIQIFNALASGATAGQPDMVIPLPAIADEGAGTHSRSGGSAQAGKRRLKVILPGGGIRFAVSISAGVYTTSFGGVNAATTRIPAIVRFFYTPYGN